MLWLIQGTPFLSLVPEFLSPWTLDFLQRPSMWHKKTQVFSLLMVVVGKHFTFLLIVV